MKKSKIVFLLSILSVSALTCIVCAGKSFFRLWGIGLNEFRGFSYYDFNGQRWYGVENEGTGKWFPKFDKCYIQGKWGNHVYCIIGSGNCWNGTSCIH